MCVLVILADACQRKLVEIFKDFCRITGISITGNPTQLPEVNVFFRIVQEFLKKIRAKEDDPCYSFLAKKAHPQGSDFS